MRSSSGEHFLTLDHVRALAAFMVFTWHFTHGTNGYPVKFEYSPMLAPFSILDEGHTGVSLFMVLSGYLFSKLLDGKHINYRSFFLNRALRLFPLLFVVIVLAGIIQCANGESWHEYATTILKGVILPVLPNGGWSIIVECHFYLLLPFLLWMLRKSRALPLTLILLAILVRIEIFYLHGQVASASYYTIIGRIDQFVSGMVVYQFGTHLANRHAFALLMAAGFSLFYWFFDASGGLHQNGFLPSKSPVWIVLPTIEGFVYAILIAWYDNSFSPSNTGVSKFIGRLGAYSYSIYLIHFFVVFDAAKFIDKNIMHMSNFYLACLWSLFVFVLMMPIGYLCFRFVEKPPLRYRRRYLFPPKVENLARPKE